MKIGDVVDERFELVELAGGGGMGVVFRAVDLQAQVGVALKLLRADSMSQRPRFVREARVLASLKHPGILDYVTHGSTPTGESYLVTEWLEGEDLETRLSSDVRLTLEQSLRIAHHVGEALGAAHRIGIVHRDIKPANLFLVNGDPGRVKILDFGLARTAAATQHVTNTGVMMGTPAYMAPEQARGAREIDGRADLFSRGCVLFECIAGRIPFDGEHVMAVLAKILLEDAPRVRDHCAEVGHALDELVASLLAKEPSDRPADAAAVVAALDRISNDEDEVHSPRVSGPGSMFSAGERRLVSVVLSGTSSSRRPSSHATAQEAGLPSRHATPSADDFTSSEATSVAELGDELTPLAARIRQLGGDLHRLVGRGLVVTVSGVGVATDQSVRAARCALAVRDALPGVPIAVATGQGELRDRLPVGAVIDRAVAVLHGAGPDEVRLDALTHSLLDGRFEVSPETDYPLLVGERASDREAPKLCGVQSPFVGRQRELNMLDLLIDSCVEEPAAQAAPGRRPAWASRGCSMSICATSGTVTRALRSGPRQGSP